MRKDDLRCVPLFSCLVLVGGLLLPPASGAAPPFPCPSPHSELPAADSSRPRALPFLTGSVVDEDDRPVSGARVELRALLPLYERFRRELEEAEAGAGPDSGEAAAAAAMTDAAGRYRLRAPFPGVWQVRISRDGYAPLERDEPVFREEWRQRELPLARLTSARLLRVRVVRPGPGTGERVPAAGVLGMYRYGGERENLLWCLREQPRRTGPDGLITLVRPSLPVDHTYVESLNLLTPGSLVTEPIRDRETSEIEVILPLPSSHEVQVLDAEGEPLAGVVLLSSAARHRTGRPIAVTDRQGRARFPESLIDLGTHDALTALGPDGSYLRWPKEPPAHDSWHVRPAPTLLRLHAPTEVVGEVRGEDGLPLAGAHVWTSEDPGGAVVTGPAGRFSLPAFRWSPWQEELRVDAAGFENLTRTLRREPGDALPPLEPFVLRAEARLAGRLVDTDGKAVAEAAVTLWGLEDYGGGHRFVPVRWARSDAEGRFLLTDPPMGEPLFLDVEAEGLRPVRVDLPPLAAGEARDDLLLQLRQPRKVVGRVESSDGEPVAGARVALLPSGMEVGFGSSPVGMLAYWERVGLAFARARTDTRGRFEVADLPARRYDLTAWAPGFARRDILWVEVPGMTEGPNDLGIITLERGGVLEGHVLDGGGEAVPSARVELQGEWWPYLPAEFRALLYDHVLGRAEASGVTAGKEGRFAFHGFTEEEASRLQVRAEGYLPVKHRLTTEDRARGEEGSLRITLHSAATVSGRVVGERGEPLEDASVKLRAEAPKESRGSFQASYNCERDDGSRGETDRAGEFRCRVAPTGQGVLRVSKSGYLTEEVDLGEVGPEGGIEGVEVVLGRGETLRGRTVNADGEPVFLKKLRVEQDGASPGLRRSRLDEHFEATGLLPGTAKVFAPGSTYFEEAEQEVEIRPGTNEVEVVLTSRTVYDVAGIVRGPEGPLAGAKVGIRGGAPSNPDAALTAAGGSFLLTRVTPGTHTLYVSHPTHYDAEPTQVTVEDGPLVGVEVTVEAGASIRGTVQGLRHFERPSLSIRARSESPPIYGGEAVLNPDGSFLFEGLRPGIWTVKAATTTGLNRAAVATVEIEPGMDEAEVDFVFEPDLDVPGPVGDMEEVVDAGESGELRLRLTGPGGRPVRGQVSVLAEDEEGRKKLRGIYDVGGRGVLKLPPMPAGPTRLYVRTPDSATATVEAAVLPGATGASSKVPDRIALGGAGDLRVEVPALFLDPEEWRRSAMAPGDVAVHLYLRGPEGEEIAVLAWNGLLSRRWRLREGERMVRGVPAGAVTARVVSEHGGVWEGRGVVTPGRTVHLTLEGDGKP